MSSRIFLRHLFAYVTIPLCHPNVRRNETMNIMSGALCVGETHWKFQWKIHRIVEANFHMSQVSEQCLQTNGPTFGLPSTMPSKPYGCYMLKEKWNYYNETSVVRLGWKHRTAPSWSLRWKCQERKSWHWNFCGGPVVRNRPTSAGDQGLIPGQELTSGQLSPHTNN